MPTNHFEVDGWKIETSTDESRKLTVKISKKDSTDDDFLETYHVENTEDTECKFAIFNIQSISHAERRAERESVLNKIFTQRK